MYRDYYISILHTRNLRNREVKQSTSGHKAREQQTWDPHTLPQNLAYPYPHYIQFPNNIRAHIAKMKKKKYSGSRREKFEDRKHMTRWRKPNLKFTMIIVIEFTSSIKRQCLLFRWNFRARFISMLFRKEVPKTGPRKKIQSTNFFFFTQMQIGGQPSRNPHCKLSWIQREKNH